MMMCKSLILFKYKFSLQKKMLLAKFHWKVLIYSYQSHLEFEKQLAAIYIAS